MTALADGSKKYLPGTTTVVSLADLKGDLLSEMTTALQSCGLKVRPKAANSAAPSASSGPVLDFLSYEDIAQIPESSERIKEKLAS